MRKAAVRLCALGSLRARAFSTGPGGPGTGLVFRQLFERESSTYTYLLGCAETREAVLIDPVLETVDRDLAAVDELGLRLVLAGNTHAHADHVTSTFLLKERVAGCRSFIGAASGAKADIQLSPGDSVPFGDRFLTVRPTPGHTDGCVTFVLDDESCAFTGDALLIRGCGRTDFQAGDARKLFRSVRGQIFSLPDETLLWPAHDYQGRTVTTVAEEKEHNPRLGLAKSEDDFVAIMDGLQLAYPKKIDVAVPRNMRCGFPVD